MDNQILLSNSMPNFAQGNALANNKKYFVKQNTPPSQGVPASVPQSQPAQSPKEKKNNLTTGQKLGIYSMTAAGILTSLAILAKTGKTKYSLNPSKILTTPLKKTFLAKTDYKVKEVLAIGAGSCIGGLAGGAIFDKDKSNFQAKKREALIQYTNISLPILTVAMFSSLGKFIQKNMLKTLEHGNNIQKVLYMAPKIISPLLGIGAGMIVGNKAANKLNNKIFKNKDERPIEVGDFSAHLDDICMASSYISEDNFLVKAASRFVPLALSVAGTEIGCKQEDIKNKK